MSYRGDGRRVASGIVRAAARIAPRAARTDLVREWEAEIAWSPHARVPLVRTACGAFAHALWLRKEQWRPDMLWQDLKYACRTLAGQPLLTILAGLTLALGIGANTAIFSVVHTVLLKPLPYADPDRLVQIWETNPLQRWTAATASPANLLDWKARNRSFEDIAFYPGMEDTPMFSNVTLASAATPERLRAVRVSVNALRVLGVQPILGRDFLDEEQAVGRHRVAILSHALWRSQFGGDPGAIGRQITLSEIPFQVIGVMPDSFRFPHPDTQLWIPLAIVEGFAAQRRPHYLRPVARLKEGVTVEQARQDLTAIAAQLEAEYPDTNTQMGVGLGPLHEWVVGDARTTLLLFMAAVALVLLVACANLANLLLARASGRARELAVRSAVGASGWRIARQTLTENLVLAAIGGMGGLLVARWTLDAIVAAAPADLPRIDEIALDMRLLVSVGMLTIVTAVLIGALPAWRSSRADVSWLRDGGRSTGGGSRVRRALVIAQVSASVALVTCAGLLLRSFERLENVSPGFDPRGVVTFRVDLPGATYDTGPKAVQFWDALRERIRAIPGVAAAGGSTVIGLKGAGWTGDLYREDRPDFRARGLRHKDITPGYFEAMGLPVTSGRDLSDADTADSLPVVVVNEALARAYFGDEDPVGKRITYQGNPAQRTWRTIVGVVADEKQDGLAQVVEPEVYESHRQNAASSLTTVVRASTPLEALVPSLRAALRDLDDGLAMYDVSTLDDLVTASLQRQRFATWLVGLFAALALTIAAVGVYGVIAYSVSRRTKEIGLRVALGADRRAVLWLVLRETCLLVGAGLAAGLVLSLAAGQAISSLLFQTSPADPITLVGVVTVLGLVALMASYVPSRRALAVAPITALRHD